MFQAVLKRLNLPLQGLEDMSIPPLFVPKVSAWLAREGFTILTAPSSLVARALAEVRRDAS